MPKDRGGGTGNRGKLRTTGFGSGIGFMPKAEKQKPQGSRVPKLLYPSQERANAKAVSAIKGIGENVKTALDMFRPKKK